MRQQAVHHHVRVPADRRGEVRVVIEGQPVVSDIRSRISRFGHRPDRKCRNEVLLLFAVNVRHQLVDVLGERFADGIAFHLVAEAHDETAQLGELVGIGFVVHAVDERAFAVLHPLAFTPHELGYFAVGQQHKLFDQLVGFLHLLEIDAQRLAVFVEVEFRLFAFEAD